MHKRKCLTIAAVVLGLCLAVPLGGQFFSWGRRSPECGDELCDAVSRKHFPLRHWQWSGIPLLEGGFIHDPHYLCSESLALSEPVNNLLSSRRSRYTIVDVNPFFNDSTSEILLLIESQGTRFEYRLTAPKHKGIQAVLAYPTPPPALVFPYRNGLAVLANFFGPAKGVYLLPLPFKSGTALDLISANSAEFATVAAAFHGIGQEPTTRDQFCESRRKDFIAFYEKYSGPCNQKSRAVSEIDGDFAYFWLGDPSTKR